MPSPPRTPRGSRVAVILRPAALLVTGLALLLAGAGCASGTGAHSSSTVVSSASTPGTATSSPGTSAAPELPRSSAPGATSGVSLASLGFLHAPENFSVPGGLYLQQTVDQSNVVTLVVPEEQGAELLNHLEATLPTEGFTITARSADSLIFSAPGWQGAFTMSDQVAGLTLRRVNQ